MGIIGKDLIMDYPPEITTRIKEARSKFIAMALTYFLGVYNDNFFKQAAMLLAVAAGHSGLQGRATVLFSLPFILFSAYAGWMADKYPKRNVVIGVKFLELAAMIIGAVGLVTLNWTCMVTMVGLMGLQSTIFGPALNGSIPELYPDLYVTKANGILKLITTAAILLGIALAGISLDQNWIATSIPFGRILVASIVITVSILGVFASFGVHKHYPAGKTIYPFPWAGPFNSIKDIIAVSKDRLLMIAIMGDAFFYFIASLAVITINTYGIVQLEFSRTTTSLLSVALLVGVCVGSLAAAKMTSVGNWTRVMPTSAMGMGAGLALSGFVPWLPDSAQSIYLFSSLILAGTSGGLFLIPLTSFIQVRPPAAEKGRIISASNFCAFSGILLSGKIFEWLDALIQPSLIMGILGISGMLAGILFFIIIKREGHRA